jgi:hypothetical protein
MSDIIATTAPRRRGRPRLYDEKAIMVSIRLGPADREMLKELSKRTKQSQSRVIAGALRMLEANLLKREEVLE